MEIYKETILHPGVFTKTTEWRKKESIESIVRKVMRDNGYPTFQCGETVCNQPNICDLLTDCGVGVALGATNGITGTGVEGDLFRLGADLTENTVISTDIYDFSVSKDFVKLDVNDAGGVLGGGEVARFIGDNGTVTAEVGVYTNNSGAPSVGERVYNSTSDAYTWLKHDSNVGNLSLRSGLQANTHYFTATLSPTNIEIGHSDTTSTSLEIKSFSFTGGSYIFLLKNLPTFASNAAAVTAGLPTDALYKMSLGGGNFGVSIVV